LRVGLGEARSRARRSHAASGIVAALILSCAGVARAQGSTRATAAEGLFHDGRALIAAHRYKEACEKLASSQKLDPRACGRERAEGSPERGGGGARDRD